MFDDPHKRTFYNAPQSVTTFVAALLEPGITVVTFIVATLIFDPGAFEPHWKRLTVTVCLLILALTDRENEVLLRVAKGFTLPEIAVQLELSRHTISDYVKQIYRKLNVSSRAEAALEAQRLGLFGRN